MVLPPLTNVLLAIFSLAYMHVWTSYKLSITDTGHQKLAYTSSDKKFVCLLVCSRSSLYGCDVMNGAGTPEG